MKKVININFQGRVVPIEESAFEQLKNYIDSLQRYFSNEEGKEEIINDIESRIAELFSEILKKGSPCIIEDDVTNIINMMGRVEDFEAEEGNGDYQHTSSKPTEDEDPKRYQNYANEPIQRGRFYRDADDKIIGGVCSGLSNYLGIDPVLIRIFAVVFFTFFFWIYLLLWLIVPSKSIESNITKRLFRDIEDKWIGGVCSGIANFFNASSHLVRLAFGIPFVIWFLSGRVRELGAINGIDDLPNLLTGSFGLGLAFIYLVLWIALPVAKTTTDKLEMRGEKVDINNIQKKVKEELESFKGKSSMIAEEMKEAASNFSKKAKEFGSEIGGTANQASERFKTTAKEAAESAKNQSAKAGSVVGGFFKIIGMLIAACLVFVLFASLLGVTVGLFMAWPYIPYFLGNSWHYFLFFSTIIFFFFVPLIALVIYFVRKLSGTKPSKNAGIAFGIAWTIGWVSLFTFIPIMINEYKISVSEEEKIVIEQPKNSITLKVQDIREFKRSSQLVYSSFESNHFFLFKDSLIIKSPDITIIPSKDSLYGLSFVKQSKGRTYEDAFERAQNIHPIYSQNGDELLVSNKVFIYNDKFRDQNFITVVKVPIGKDIMMSNDYDRSNNLWVRQNSNVVSSENVRRNIPSRALDYNVIYRMTEQGLKSLEEIKEEAENNNETLKQESSVDTLNTKIRGNREIDSTQNKSEVYEYPGKN